MTQIFRSDKWKDPEGFIHAFNLARQEVEKLIVKSTVNTQPYDKLMETIARKQADLITA